MWIESLATYAKILQNISVRATLEMYPGVDQGVMQVNAAQFDIGWQAPLPSTVTSSIESVR